MNPKKHISIVLCLLTVSIQIIGSEWHSTFLADLKLVNKTGQFLYVETIYKDGRSLRAGLDEDRKTIENGLVLSNQNLKAIKNYKIYYKDLKGRGTLSIDAEQLRKNMLKKEQFEAVITILPRTIIGYIIGFQNPLIFIKPKPTGKKTVEEVEELEQTFVLMPESEKVILLASLNATKDTPANQIFGLKKAPKADSKKVLAQQSKEVREYLDKLNKRRDELLEKWHDDLNYDTKMYKKYGIKDYRAKVRKLIEAAYKSILDELKI